jgi:NTP pyrophosphatase (non-canonical NTP hydrolase)
MNNSLNFSALRASNVKRALLWHKGGLGEWTASDWAVAVMGEAGEMCDAIKKLNRLRDHLDSNNPRQPRDISAAKAAIAQEIGDTLVYLDLLSAALDLSLEECVVNTFNRISDREGFDIKL